jgi:phosphopantetheine adenylyltransferase
METSCVILQVAAGNQEIHDENFAKLTALEHECVYAILDGELEKVDMNDLAQYYTYFGEIHPKSDLTIVLPVNLEYYLLNVLPTCNLIFQFGNEWKLDDINAKRVQHGLQSIVVKQLEPSKSFESEKLNPMSNKVCNQFENVYIGGTFDHLHVGHKLLFTQMLFVTKTKCCAAIANGDLLKNKKFKEQMQSFEVRSHHSQVLMRQIRPDVISTTCELLDPFGPPITDESCDCLVVSLETIKGGDKINEIRREKHWKDVFISCIPLVQYKNAK